MRKIQISLEAFFLGSGLFTCFGLCLSVALACTYTIDCSSRLPTLSYTSKFPFHDKLFLFLMTVFSCTHFWIYIALNKVLRDINSILSQCVQIAGLCCVPCLLMMTLIDQNINKDIHAALAFVFLGMELFYVFSIKAILLPSHPLYQSHFKSRLRNMRKCDSIIILCTLVTTIEFYVANLPSNRDSFFHGTVQATSQYILCFGGILYPWLLSKILPSTSISLKTQSDKLQQ